MITSLEPVTAAGHSHQPEPAELAAGFKQVEAEILSMPGHELVPVNVDVQGAVTVVLGALPELRALRTQFAELKGFELRRFDKLRNYALALGHAHAMYRIAAGPTNGVTALATEPTALRDVPQSDATALAAATLRQRAFTLFANTYDEVRRAVSYLRWHENDVDDIAPSLDAGRGGGTHTDPSTDPTLPDGTRIVTPPVASTRPSRSRVAGIRSV